MISGLDEEQRPITAHELDIWIARQFPELGNQLDNKYDNCFSTIIAVWPLKPVDQALIRYTCISPSTRLDRMCSFFGLSAAEYNPSVSNRITLNRAQSKRAEAGDPSAAVMSKDLGAPRSGKQQ
jgi:hypothetical protein